MKATAGSEHDKQDACSTSLTSAQYRKEYIRTSLKMFTDHINSLFTAHYNKDINKSVIENGIFKIRIIVSKNWLTFNLEYKENRQGAN